MIWALVRRLTGFSWSTENVRVGLITIAMIGIGFGGLTLLPAMYGIGVASVAMVLSSVYSLRILAAFIEPQRVPAPIRRVLTACGVMHAIPVCTESSI
jgi:PST family polysaccharide transporter